MALRSFDGFAIASALWYFFLSDYMMFGFKRVKRIFIVQ